MKKAERAEEPVKPYRYLADRTKHWGELPFVLFYLFAAALVVVAAFHSPSGFWPGLWEALTKFM